MPASRGSSVRTSATAGRSTSPGEPGEHRALLRGAVRQVCVDGAPRSAVERDDSGALLVRGAPEVVGTVAAEHRVVLTELVAVSLAQAEQQLDDRLAADEVAELRGRRVHQRPRAADRHPPSQWRRLDLPSARGGAGREVEYAER